MSKKDKVPKAEVAPTEESVEAVAATEDKGVQPAPQETVTVAKEDLDYLMNQVRSLTEKVGGLEGGAVDTFQQPDPIAMIRLIDGKVVVRLTDSWNVKDPVSKEITAMIGIHLEDMKEEDKPVEMELVEYLRDAEQATVTVKERRVTDPGVVDLGMVEQTKYKDYRAERSGIRVPNRVVTPVFEYDVEMKDGRQFTISQTAMN